MNTNLPEKVKVNIDQFTGRTWLLEKILTWYDKTGDRLLLITGKPGTGKSMVAAWLAGFGPLPGDLTNQQRLIRIRSLVKGAHFCRANSLDNSPKEMAENLAGQLTERLPGFGAALANLAGKERIELIANMEIGKVEPGGNATGFAIGKLDLGGLFDEPSFDLAMCKPLRKVFDTGGEPGLLLVDALDEAAVYEGKFKIIQAILKLVDLNTQLRVMVTLRDEPDVLQSFRGYPTIDLIEDAPDDKADVRSYVIAHLEGLDNDALQQVAEQVVKNARGNFLFAHLVVDDLTDRLKKNEQLTVEDVPSKLADFYHQNLLRLMQGDMKIWRKSLRPLLGVVAVTQDPGVKRLTLAKITRRDKVQKLDDLRICKPYLDGSLDDGPFRLFHKSLSDFLLEDADNDDFHVDGSEAHSNIVYYYWPRKTNQVTSQKWDSYGWRAIATHLAGASHSDDENQCHFMARRLVDLVVNPQHQKDYLERIKDSGQYERDLSLAVQSACRDPLEASLPLVIRAAHQLFAFRQTQLQPRRVFRLAARGELDAALSHLTLFPMDDHWTAAAQLLIAWLAAEAGDPRSQQLHQEVLENYRLVQPLPLLEQRVHTAWGGPMPVLETLPIALPQEHLEAAVYNTRSDPIQAGMLVSYLAEAKAHVGEQIYEGLDTHQASDATPAKRANVDGPILVAYAAAHPKSLKGSQAFLSYLNVMAANQYRIYRNLSLWELLDAALRHPDNRWTREALIRVVSAALSPKGAEFTESFQLVLIALKARLGIERARQLLDERYSQALSRASTLSEERGRNDVTGAHKRRLCALALAYHLLPDGGKTAQELIQSTFDLPRGYAGFMVKAWFSLAETIQILSITDSSPDPALMEAMVAAHYITNPAYCARLTAIANAMSRRWWPFPSHLDLADTIHRFIAKPFAPEYSAVHIVGDQYAYRTEPELRQQLSSELLDAKTPAAIAEALMDKSNKQWTNSGIAVAIQKRIFENG